MEVMVILIGFSLIVALGFLGAFFWAVRSGQFDDAVTPSYRILFDDRSGRKQHTSRNAARQDHSSSSSTPANQSSHSTTSNQTERDR
ncbi:MAG: cbb3-type cytochrome oxidase assembly protein CcoS [Bacteroidota bacterium]